MALKLQCLTRYIHRVRPPNNQLALIHTCDHRRRVDAVAFWGGQRACCMFGGGQYTRQIGHPFFLRCVDAVEFRAAIACVLPASRVVATTAAKLLGTNDNLIG